MSDSDNLAVPALLKVARAEHHINDLKRSIASYLGEKPFRLVTSGDRDACNQTHFIKQQMPIPDGFALIAGDAVHNLRSALDILIFGMIGHLASKPEKFNSLFRKGRTALYPP